jgi:hypothetical protein
MKQKLLFRISTNRTDSSTCSRKAISIVKLCRRFDRLSSWKKRLFVQFEGAEGNNF